MKNEFTKYSFYFFVFDLLISFLIIYFVLIKKETKNKEQTLPCQQRKILIFQEDFADHDCQIIPHSLCGKKNNDLIIIRPKRKKAIFL